MRGHVFCHFNAIVMPFQAISGNFRPFQTISGNFRQFLCDSHCYGLSFEGKLLGLWAVLLISGFQYYVQFAQHFEAQNTMKLTF